MIAIPLHDAAHGHQQPFGRCIAEFRDIGYFAPHQHAEAVRELIVARIGNLDMASEAIEPHCLGRDHLLFEQVERRRQDERVGIIVLIERAAQVKRLAVEVEAAGTRFDRAKTELIAPCIDRLVVAAEPQSSL